ncbi:MAG: nuclear transport factor 2 family protein [Gemmatimonadota bacterium]
MNTSIAMGCLGIVILALPLAARAQQRPDERMAVIAVVDSALAAVSRTDFGAFSTFMLPEAVMFAVQHVDSVRGYNATSRQAVHDTKLTDTFTERGFRHDVKIAGPVAIAWVPYDFYRNGTWSHCGVDVFTLLRTDGRWRISSLAYTVAQPPACEKHPDGPPK